MKNILVVEDNRNYNYLLKHTFQKRGYSVTSVFNGRQAMKSMKTAARPIDIIVLDLMMPEMGGREFLEFLENANLKNKPAVCILSAKIDKSIVKDLKNVSVVGYFVKGEHLDDLIYKIEFSNIIKQPVKSIASVYTLGELLTHYQIVNEQADSIIIRADREIATNSILQISVRNEEQLLHVENVQPDGVATLLTCRKIYNLGEVG